MIRPDVRLAVRRRARERCEYCGLRDGDSPLFSHPIEHIVPRKHGGSDDLENLALACVACNLYRGSNLEGLDPVRRELTPLFHPRRDEWADHFLILELILEGRTAVRPHHNRRAASQ